MKKKLRFVIVLAIALTLSADVACATQEKQETLGDKLKKLFVRPTPTPKPKKKKRATAPPSASATQSVTQTPSAPQTESPAPAVSPASSATAQPSETPQPTVTVSKSQRPKPAAHHETQYLEPVRAISPGPRSRRRAPAETTATPAATETPVEIRTPIPNETETSRPAPSLPPVVASSATAGAKKSAAPTTTPSLSTTVAASATPVSKKSVAPTAAGFSIDAIADSPSYPPEIRKIVDLSVELAGKNLSYKYVSADPAKGGMDSSGFISYVLAQSGIKDVPRDARQQYVWVRKAGNFQAVLAQRDDTFELDALKPGDLLFWASNYGISKDPDITQTMIYLGRDKTTKQRLMIGASETQTPKGRTRPGVGVFEFKVGRTAPKGNKEAGPVFVGYGHAPGSQ